MQVFTGFEKYLWSKQRCTLNMGEVENPEDQSVQLVRPVGGGMVWVFQTHRKSAADGTPGNMRPECADGWDHIPEIGELVEGTDDPVFKITYRSITDTLFDTERAIYNGMIAPPVPDLTGGETTEHTELHAKYAALRNSLL